MPRDYQEPTIEPIAKRPGAHHDSVERHPGYGTISASRVSSSPGVFLFGSDFRHRDFMTISIYRAEVERGLSNDWVHADPTPVIEVALSEAQWATFVSSPNVGMGVPCTIESIERKQLPGISRKTDRREQFRNEMQATTGRSVQAFADLRAALIESKLSQKAKDDLLKLVETAVRSLGGSAEFICDQFDEHMEHTVERAKVEVNAYMQTMMLRAGLESLAEQARLELASGDEGKGER